MKIRIPFAVAFTAFILWSCDEPIAYDNNSFTYNPFTFIEDTLNNVASITSGDADIAWGSHFRAWVGETEYYKSGFTVEFVFPDTTLDIAGADSICFQIKHVKTYPQNGSDTLGSTYSRFGYYETMDQLIDVENSVYGDSLGTNTMNIAGGSNSWNYTLPADIIVDGDTTVSLGIFPTESGYLSSCYGGGSVSRPSLSFFYHEIDSAGADSATFITFLADTLSMHLIEKSAAFDRANFEYISQLKTDSVQMTLSLLDLAVTGDTLQHIITSSILPAIDETASALYMPDSVFSFNMRVEDPNSGRFTTINYAGTGYQNNEVKLLIQSAIDAKDTELNLIFSASNPGYNPGFIAISKDVTQSAIYVKSSLAVRP